MTLWFNVYKILENFNREPYYHSSKLYPTKEFAEQMVGLEMGEFVGTYPVEIGDPV